MKVGYFADFEYSRAIDFFKARNLTQIEWHLLEDYSLGDLSFDACIFSEAQASGYFQNSHHLSSAVRSMGGCDLLLKERDKMWPQNLLSEVLPAQMIMACPSLDTRAHGYVAGDLGWAQSTIGCLIQMGFSKIYWIGKDIDSVNKQLLLLQQNYFGVQLQSMTMENLIHQPNNGSILISTLKQNGIYSKTDDENDLAIHLTYLNFVKRGGLVVDLQLLPLENQLLTEAKNVGNCTLHGSHVAWQWWKKFFQYLGVRAPEIRGLIEKIEFLEFEEFLKLGLKPS